MLQSLRDDDIVTLLSHAVDDYGSDVTVSDDALLAIATAADGDARRSLNLLEIILEAGFGQKIGREQANQVLSGELTRRFDNGGDVFYDQISALHKSVRGSSPDGALYWYARMLDGGIDPIYIARRQPSQPGKQYYGVREKPDGNFVKHK